MSKILFVFGVFIVLQVASGNAFRVARDTAAAPATGSVDVVAVFREVSDKADAAVKTLHEDFLKFWGVKNDNELSSLIQTQSKTYADKLQATIVQLTEEAKNGPVGDAVKSVTEKLNEHITELKTKNPEFFSDAAKYQESFQQNVKGVLAETEKLTDKLKVEGQGTSENFQAILKTLYENTVQVASTVSKQVENAVAAATTQKSA